MTGSAFRDLAKMAYKNLSRHRAKTVITSIAVAISVALYIFVDAWLLGMNLDSRRNIVSYEIGAAKIQTKAYFNNKDELPMYESFKPWENMVEILKKKGFAAAPRFVFEGTLYAGAGTAPMIFNAVDPSLEAQVLRYPSYVERGRFIRPGAFELVLGTLAADKLRLDIPRSIETAKFTEDILSDLPSREDAAFIRSLYTEDQGLLSLKKDLSAAELDRYWNILEEAGKLNVRISTVIDIKTETGQIKHVNQLIDARVVGILNSPNPKTNGNVGYIPLDVLQDDAGLMLDGRVTEILVRSDRAKDSELPGPAEGPQAIRRALTEGLADQGKVFPPELGVYGWQDYVKDYFAASQGDNVSSRIMVILLFILSFIGIANTMLMAILERTKEIGMLRALGMTDGEIVLSYVLESSYIGVIGSLFGIFVGCLINIPMVNYGIDYSSISKAMNGDYGYRIVSFFRSAWNPGVIAASGLVATLLSAAMAVLPTLRALKMPVTESLRFE